MKIKPENFQTSLQHLHLPFYFQCNHPLVKSEFEKIIFLEDTVPVKPKFSFTDSLYIHVKLEYKWKSKSKYSVFIPPLTFIDIYGLKNDSIKLDFTTHSENDYGSVKIKIQKSDSISYIIQLIDDFHSVVLREYKTSTDTIITSQNLDPYVYKIKLILDLNNNGKWDTGDYMRHIQPEEVEFYPENIVVRANWDVDVTIKLPLMSNKLK